MSGREALMLKCIEALMDMNVILAVSIDSNSGLDGEAYYRAYGKYNAAHYDLIHADDEQGRLELGDLD